MRGKIILPCGKEYDVASIYINHFDDKLMLELSTEDNLSTVAGYLDSHTGLQYESNDGEIEDLSEFRHLTQMHITRKYLAVVLDKEV